MTEERLALSELLEKAGDGGFPAKRGGGGAANADGGRRPEGLIGAGRMSATGNERLGATDTATACSTHGLARFSCAFRSCGRAATYPPFLEARKVSEKALIAVIQEAWIGERLNAAGRRSGAGDGTERDRQVAGLQAVQGHRRTCACLP